MSLSKIGGRLGIDPTKSITTFIYPGVFRQHRPLQQSLQFLSLSFGSKIFTTEGEIIS